MTPCRIRKCIIQLSNPAWSQVVKRGGGDNETAARKANEKAVSKAKMTMKAGGRELLDQAQFTKL